MKLKYTSKWEPTDYYNGHGVRGDEKRTFTVAGVEGWMKVTESGGRWNHMVQVDGEIVASNRSWGEGRKRDAMKNSTDGLKIWIAKNGV